MIFDCGFTPIEAMELTLDEKIKQLDEVKSLYCILPNLKKYDSVGVKGVGGRKPYLDDEEKRERIKLQNKKYHEKCRLERIARGEKVRTVWPKETKAEIQRLRESGVKPADIAERMKIKVEQVYDIMRYLRRDKD